MLLVIIFVTLICSCKKSANNQAVTSDYSIQIDSLIKTKSPRLFNGVILITQNGKTKFLREYGYSDFDNKIKISVHDKFRIMSNSKQITAVLVLRQVQKGTISLTSPIDKYIKNIEQPWVSKVNVHHLLNMSSGIANTKEPLLFEPGTDYKYSNPGYGLLGKILESVTGKSYQELVLELFAELGMENTYPYALKSEDQELIHGNSLKEGIITKVDFKKFGFKEEGWNNFLPAGGIVSNAHDLAIWDFKLHNGKILNDKYYRLMTTPSNSGPHAAFDNDTIGYAYGLRVDDNDRIKHIGHGGRGFGFVSLKFYIPEKKISVIIWENIYIMDGDWRGGSAVYFFENELRKLIVNSSLVEQ